MPIFIDYIEHFLDNMEQIVGFDCFLFTCSRFSQVVLKKNSDFVCSGVLKLFYIVKVFFSI